GQAEAEFLVGQADDAFVRGGRDNLTRALTLARPAEDQDSDPGSDGELPREVRKVPDRPVLGRSEGAAGIEADHMLAAIETEPAPGPIRRGLIGGRSGQLQPTGLDRTAQMTRQLQISVDDRCRQPSSVVVDRVMQDFGEQEAPAVPLVSHAARYAPEERHDP